MEPQEETDDPQQALATIWQWLSSAGPNFPGGWRLSPDPEQHEHKAELSVVALPDKMRKHVKDVIRQAALDAGWLAKHVSFHKDRVAFVLKPYPLEKRLADEARSEEFRQEARRKRLGTPLDRASGRTPEP